MISREDLIDRDREGQLRKRQIWSGFEFQGANLNEIPQLRGLTRASIAPLFSPYAG